MSTTTIKRIIFETRSNLRASRRELCGNVLKQWRKDKGIGTLHLANVTGLRERYIQQVEAGVIDPTATTLKLMCDALDEA